MWETQVRSLGQEDPLEEEMATHSSTLAWRIPGTGEPGGLPSMGSHRIGHDWSDLAAAAAVMDSWGPITYLNLLLLCFHWASLVVQTVKIPPAMWETQVRSLGWEGPLEEGMATHSSILAWRIPGTAEPGGLPSMGSHRIRDDWSDLAAAAAAYDISPSLSDLLHSVWQSLNPSVLLKMALFHSF